MHVATFARAHSTHMWPEPPMHGHPSQSLDLYGNTIARTPTWLPQLQRLTALDLEANGDAEVGPAISPDLAALTALQRICLSDDDVPWPIRIEFPAPPAPASPAPMAMTPQQQQQAPSVKSVAGDVADVVVSPETVAVVSSVSPANGAQHGQQGPRQQHASPVQHGQTGQHALLSIDTPPETRAREAQDSPEKPPQASCLLVSAQFEKQHVANW